MVKDDKVVPAVGQLRFFREEIESSRYILFLKMVRLVLLIKIFLVKFVDEEAVLRKME